MVMLDGTYDGGGDDLNEDLGHNEVDHSGDYSGEEQDGDDPYAGEADYDYPQQEYYENDADDFESHQCALDEMGGYDDY